jgi:phage shock protein A
MGRIARLKRITKARIEAFLDSVERPEDILPQLEKEMAQKVTEAANAEAKGLSAVTGAQRKVDEATGRALRLEKGAKLAVEADDVETSRRAIAALLDAEGSVERYNRQVATAQRAYSEAKSIRKQLQQNLIDIKRRKKEILARNRRAKLSKQAIRQYEAVTPKGMDDILEMVGRMESKVDLAESEVEVENHLTQTIDITMDSKQLDRKLRDAEVDRRLGEMKSKYRTQ